jgi:Mn-dependent DtxR family transcriptional regulator
MAPGSGRMVQTIAQRMGITFDETSSIADDCARRDWVDHRQHTVSLREEGRRVAAGSGHVLCEPRALRPRDQLRS